MCQEMNNINAGTRHSWRNELYNDQIWVNDRFQEPIPVEDWVDGTTKTSEELDTHIQHVPVTFYVSGDDSVCPTDHNKKLYWDTDVYSVWHEVHGVDHGYGAWVEGDLFLSKMVAAIETGKPSDYNDFYTDTYDQDENDYWDEYYPEYDEEYGDEVAY